MLVTGSKAIKESYHFFWKGVPSIRRAFTGKWASKKSRGGLEAVSGKGNTPGEPAALCKTDTVEHLERDSLWTPSSAHTHTRRQEFVGSCQTGFVKTYKNAKSWESLGCTFCLVDATKSFKNVTELLVWPWFTLVGVMHFVCCFKNEGPSVAATLYLNCKPVMRLQQLTPTILHVHPQHLWWHVAHSLVCLWLIGSNQWADQTLSVCNIMSFGTEIVQLQK